MKKCAYIKCEILHDRKSPYCSDNCKVKQWKVDKNYRQIALIGNQEARIIKPKKKKSPELLKLECENIVKYNHPFRIKLIEETNEAFEKYKHKVSFCTIWQNTLEHDEFTMSNNKRKYIKVALLEYRAELKEKIK